MGTFSESASRPFTFIPAHLRMQSLWFLANSNPGRHSQATPPLGLSLQMWAQPCSLFIQLRPSGTEKRRTMKLSRSERPARHKGARTERLVRIVLTPCSVQKHPPACYLSNFTEGRGGGGGKNNILQPELSLPEKKTPQTALPSTTHLILLGEEVQLHSYGRVTAEWSGLQDLQRLSRPSGVERTRI